VDFVEFASPAIATLLSNVKLIGCEDQCHIYRKKVHSYLKGCTARYDIIFLDPPYDKNLINPTLKSIFASDMLHENAVIIVEHSPKESIAEELSELIFKQKSGKSCSFSWLNASPNLPS